jgi:putative transposase
MPYDKGCHTVFHHRYHLVWITKYRYKVLKGAVRERVREILRQVCEELGVSIISGALSTDHVHMFVSIPPKHAVSDVMRRLKGRSSRKIQMPRPPQTLLGEALLGAGLLLYNKRAGNRPDHTSVHREPRTP